MSLTGASGKKATRPCPCGYLGHYSHRCRCTPDQVIRYRSRISGPLLDRIDIQLEVPAVAPEDLGRVQSGETSAAVRSRVARARARQMERQDKPNARLEAPEVDVHCAADKAGTDLLAQAIRRLGLSARGYHRILKVARTIADLAGDAHVRANHLAEAIQYRRYERG